MEHVSTDDSTQTPNTSSDNDGHEKSPSPVDDTDNTAADPEVQEGGCLARVRQAYEPLGVRDDIIRRLAAVEGAREMLLSPRCNTPEKEAECTSLLSFATGEVLGALAEAMGMPVGVVTLVASAVRRLAPGAFDNWVNFQLSNGMGLGMITAVRNPADVPREGFIEDQLAKGNLAFGIITPVQCRLANFVGILRPKLEAGLGVTTDADQMELDAALDAYLNARRFRAMAESLIAPLPVESDVRKSLAFLEMTNSYDKTFHTTIERIRTRIQKQTRKIRVGARTNVALQVSASMVTEASSSREALSA